MQRRGFMGQVAAGVTGAGLAACGGSSADAVPRKPTFVFLHGAWHGAWCWSKVVILLARQGYCAVALDLPGHGVTARFPASYLQHPQDLAALATEVSPLAAITTNDYRDHVLGVLRGLIPEAGPVIVVAHSLGGATLSAVAEAAPELIRRMIYLSAFCPVLKPTPLDYILAPSGSTSLVPPLFLGDPNVIACARINQNSAAPADVAMNKAAFYADVSDADFAAVANLLTPDEPIGALVTPVIPSAAKWGSLPRAYIRCQQDRALVPPMQDQMIAEADALTPNNKFVQKVLNTSHSPFMSNPQALVDILVALA